MTSPDRRTSNRHERGSDYAADLHNIIGVAKNVLAARNDHAARPLARDVAERDGRKFIVPDGQLLRVVRVNIVLQRLDKLPIFDWDPKTEKPVHDMATAENPLPVAFATELICDLKEYQSWLVLEGGTTCTPYVAETVVELTPERDVRPSTLPQAHQDLGREVPPHFAIPFSN